MMVRTLTDYVSKEMQAQSHIMNKKRKMEEAKAKGKGQPAKTSAKASVGSGP